VRGAEPANRKFSRFEVICLNVKGLLAASLTALTVAAPAAAAPAVGAPSANLGCGAGKVVVNVRYHVVNDVDTGVKGNNWAFDNYLRTLRVVRTNAGHWCAGSTYDGMFTSIAGPSPGGRATLPAGVRGTFKGASVTTFRATFTPGAAHVRGDLGTRDFQCTSDDTKGACAGTFDWLATYFTSADNFASFKYAGYRFEYHATAGGHGTWTDRLAGGKIRTQGDIVPTKKRAARKLRLRAG
jgi:hypothetical protein